MSDGLKSKLQRFGRYLILDHLVDGGMAKICRARFLGEQVDKVVIIKMVQPQFSNDESFRTMFMDEIKVTYGLLHPNIVQTYDYGLYDGQLFVAMEYCDGRNLKEYFDKLRKRKFVFPVEISVYIITQVCQGLHYAHTFADKLTGEEAKIIHRDISPHNIMLTYDGSIKVIDFGIAKSETNSETTQAGTIKGKLSYLAPEYLDGLELDPRYDEFATGITLWEMLCSRKLFKAPNDLAVLKKIQECKVPAPSSINPNVPKELDDIILKALSKDRNKRFENLDRLNRALIKFLYSTYPDFNSTDLSYFAKELFKDEIAKDKEKLYSFGRIDVAPYLADLANETVHKSPFPPAAPAADPIIDKNGANNNLTIPSKVEYDFGYKKKEGGGTNIVKNQDSSDDLSVQRNINQNKDKTNSNKKAPRNSTINNKSKSLQKNIKMPLFKIATVLILFAFGFMKFGSDIFDDNNKGLKISKNKKDSISVDSEVEDDIREPTSLEKNENGFMNETVDENFTLVRLKNLDKHNVNVRVFLNNKIEKVDYLGRLKIPKFKDVNIRVEEIGRVPFRSIAYNVANDPAKVITVKLGGSLSFGTLFMSDSKCDEGILSFTLWDEPRTLKVPFSNHSGYKLPGGYSEAAGKTGAREYNMIFIRRGETKKYEISFSLDPNGRVDFCSLIP